MKWNGHQVNLSGDRRTSWSWNRATRSATTLTEMKSELTLVPGYARYSHEVSLVPGHQLCDLDLRRGDRLLEVVDEKMELSD
jgi:hypothetical protein